MTGRPEPPVSNGTAPPRLARWLLRRVLAGPARSAIVGDLDEEFACFVVPRLGIRRAGWWYWRQSLLSIAACARGAAVSDHPLDEMPHHTMRAVMFDRNGLSADLRAGMRLCLRNPWTSIAVVFTLAMGIATNTAVFSIFNAALLKKLPIAHVDRLVTIGASAGGSFTYPEYLSSQGTAGWSAIIAGGRTSMLWGDGPATRRVTVEMISANYFEALGVGRPLRGRLLTADDDAPGDAVAGVVSERFWRAHLHSEDAAVGRTIRLQHGFITIAGVAPRGFFGAQAGFSPDVWIPLAHSPAIEGNPAMLGAGSAWLGLLGVLEHADSMTGARDALTARWRASGRNATPIVTLIPRGRTPFFGPSTNQLQVLAIFVGLILAVGCLNVATLLGATVHDRAKELAIRTALGAGRVRLLRQLLVEHLALWIVSNAYVTPGFFPALTLPLLRGRDFTFDDGPSAPRVAIVNETLARRAFGASDPVGRRVSWANAPTFDIEIVGVVRDFRSEDLRHEPPDAIFFPMAQLPTQATASRMPTGRLVPMDVTIALRVADGQQLAASDIVQRMRAFDARLYVDAIRTFNDEASRTLAHERLLAWAGSSLGAGRARRSTDRPSHGIAGVTM